MMRKIARPITSRFGESFLTAGAPLTEQDYAEDLITVVSPASYGSLGDEALLGGAFAANQSAGYSTAIRSPGDPSGWPRHLGQVEGMDNARHPLGFHWRATDLSLAGKKLVILGADSIDGLYGVRSVTARVRLANDHVSAGGEAHFSNFSLRSGVDPGIGRILRRLDPRVTLSARDSLSQKRAVSLFEREVLVAPDVAQFLNPEETVSTRHAIGIMDEARAAGKPVIALVPNAHFGALYGNGHNYAQGLAAVIHTLTQEGIFVCVLTHDRRSDPGDETLAKTVYSEVGIGKESISLYLSETAAEAKAVLRHTDLVVTGRMHAAVAALSSSVPTVGLDYADKFIGQFAWYDAHDLVVSRDILLHPTRLHAFIIQALSERRRPKADNARLNMPAWLS